MTAAHVIAADLAEFDYGHAIPEGTWGLIAGLERLLRSHVEFQEYLTERGDTE